jgi:hypothetical protein
MERVDKKQRLEKGTTSERKRSDEDRSRDKLVADALAMKEEREALPIFSGVFYKFFLLYFLCFIVVVSTAKDALLKEIYSRDVSIVVGETGSGKTTQLPQFLVGDSRFGGCVCVTQPRRVAAVTVAARIAAEMGEEVGKDRVGYCVRFDEKSSNHAVIRVLTDGMLMREMMVDPSLRRYSVVILDEAHERSLQTDILMSLLKALQKKRKHKLRIVIMSATLNPGIFMGFFGLDESSILYVEGRQYPVRILYTKVKTKEKTTSCVVFLRVVLCLCRSLWMTGWTGPCKLCCKSTRQKHPETCWCFWFEEKNKEEKNRNRRRDLRNGFWFLRRKKLFCLNLFLMEC